jgi:hypothetical protein
MEDSSMGRVWKEFGKQTEAGKLLYQLYGVRYRPDNFVNYPKLKVKTKEEKEYEEKLKSQRPKSTTKIVNAVNKIDYPEINPNKYSRYKFAKVDLIPKRKNENNIKEELQKIKKDIQTGVSSSSKINQPNMNRKLQIEKLQDKFMFQERTVMPKGARLPGVKVIESNTNSDTNTFNTLENKPTKPKFNRHNRREELEYLYDQIMKEIDERYVYMEDIKKLGKDMDLIIMGEIKERIDELKKVQKMITDYDNQI